MNKYLTDAELMQRFYALRKAKGLSAQQLSDLSGVGRSRIADMESGKRGGQLKLQEAMALAEALGLDFVTALSPAPIQIAAPVFV